MKNRVEWAAAPFFDLYGRQVRYGEVRRVRVIARWDRWAWIQQGKRCPETIAVEHLQPDPGAKQKGGSA